MRFFIRFYCSFLTLSIISSIILSAVDSNETLIGTVLVNVAYFFVGGPVWLLINILVGNRYLVLIALRFILGLLFFNLLIFALSGDVDFFNLIGYGSKYSSWLASFVVHGVFVVSFIFGSIKKRVPQNVAATVVDLPAAQPTIDEAAAVPQPQAVAMDEPLKAYMPQPLSA